MTKLPHILVSAVVLALHALPGLPAEPRQISIEDSLPYGGSPIDYLGSAAADPVARLDRRLAAGEVTLKAEPGRGYLASVLRSLDIPVSSQLLVYSRTAVNQKLIGPATPRAIYFGTSAYVAWVPGAAELELAAIDPQKGGMFYVLTQPASSGGAAPRFRRKASCLACHVGRTTLSVPGLIARSFQVDRSGKPLFGYSRITGTTPLSNRWGGWFVTGSVGRSLHVGNLLGRADNRRHKREPGFRGNLKTLEGLVDLSGYLAPHSDVVAHLVLEHQLHGQNLVFRVGYEHRLGRRSDAAERLLRYLFLVDAAPLTDTVRGTSGFARWFAERGPRTRNGRSLRQLDLRRRLFRHRLSYLVYSPEMAGLPEEPRRSLGRRVWAVLRGEENAGWAKSLTAAERKAVREILTATREQLPDGWRGDR